MKKLIAFIFVVILCAGSVFTTIYFSDNQKPTITVKNTPSLSCNITYDDLIKSAEAKDDNLKNFFIEEDDLSSIANSGSLTYVAIDESNNITKLNVPVDIDKSVLTYHIETIKPLKFQIKQTYNAEDYFVLKNKCGWQEDDDYIIEGVDFNYEGTYDAVVSSKNHHDIEALHIAAEVGDFLSPKIILNTTQANNYTERIFTDDYFMSFIDHIEDDEDDPNDLMNKIVINWKEVLPFLYDGYVDVAGTYQITYRVTDSQGNTGKTSLTLVLEKQIQVETDS